MFEVAYSLNELGYVDDSEYIYDCLLRQEPDNSLILNNLSHIKRQKNQFRDAFELIQRARELVPQDEVIAENYHQLLAVVQKQESLRENYAKALNFLGDEDDFVLEHLKRFVKNLQREPDFENNRLAMSEWTFGTLSEAELEYARILRQDWLAKGYIRDTKQRDRQLTPIYELNPFLPEELKQIEPRQLPAKWIKGLETLSIEHLDRLAYFSLLRKIRTMEKKFRDIAERDLNELFFNYLMKNEKAVIVLSGSLLEVILVYYCEQKEITKLYFQRKNNRTEKRDLYECDLAEILQYLREKKVLSDLFVHVGNISRIYRNYIHPGRELREDELLSQSNSDLCFLSSLEIIKALL